jgi:hypothetical protein
VFAVLQAPMTCGLDILCLLPQGLCSSHPIHLMPLTNLHLVVMLFLQPQLSTRKSSLASGHLSSPGCSFSPSLDITFQSCNFIWICLFFDNSTSCTISPMKAGLMPDLAGH